VTGETGSRPGIEKALTGIGGFDRITGGGLPRGRTSLLIGGPGTGKTIFALQTLVNGARDHGEPAIMVAFEEPSAEIRTNAASFGWDLPALEKDRLFFLDSRHSADVVRSGSFDLAGTLATLGAKADEMGARRIAFDSIDVLLALLDGPIQERHELYRIRDWLAGRELTGLMSVRLLESGLRTMQRYGFVQFMSDCVIELDHRIEDGVSARSLRVIKYRGSDYAANEAPATISENGLQVASFGLATSSYAASDERVSSGVSELDRALRGGFFRGSSVLVTGAPGTAKTSLAGAFIEAACQRGERALLFPFDEAAEEVVRNLRSVGIDLQSHVEAGLLRIAARRAGAASAEQHLMAMEGEIEGFEPQCIAVDPLSAMVKAGGLLSALSMAQRLIVMAKSAGITLLATSLLGKEGPESESTPLQVSTLADTWIHLLYDVQAGERNRTLSVVKSRGTGHSNQVRELVLGDEGITLRDVYVAGGEVLTGTLRWEKEAQQVREREVARMAAEQRRQRLVESAAQARAEIERLQHQVEAIEHETELLERQLQAQEEQWGAMRRGMERARGEDGGWTGGDQRPADGGEGR
jgi:circadian clock protein KaiC